MIHGNFLTAEQRRDLTIAARKPGLEHRKPQKILRKLLPGKQAAFIAAYEALLNSLDTDEAALFVDAVHPADGVHAAGCWAPKDVNLAVSSRGVDRVYKAFRR
jgi:hypothetical protein